MISIPYTRSNGQFTFSDTLFIDEEVYATMTSDDVTAMQDARFAAWLDHLQSASNEPPVEATNG